MASDNCLRRPADGLQSHTELPLSSSSRASTPFTAFTFNQPSSPCASLLLLLLLLLLRFLPPELGPLAERQGYYLGKGKFAFPLHI